MYSTCLIKNLTTEAITLLGTVIDPDTSYQIPDNLRIKWYSSDAVIYALTHGQIQVGDGTQYFSSYSNQIDWLRIAKMNATVTNFGPMDDLGVPSVVFQKPSGMSLAISSHNFCDPCTWFGESTRVTDEELTLDSGTTYESLHQYWIDLDHGRYYGEDAIKAAYLPVIKVGGVEVTEGFSINFEQGKVTFDSAPGGTVTASYSYADGSTYMLQPPPGHKYTLEHTEINFSVPTEISSHMVFEMWAYNPYDLPNKAKVSGFKYKSAKDFVTTSNLGQGVITAFGELTQDIIILPYNYGCSSALLSSQGLEVRVFTHDNKSLDGGEIGTVTFYVKLAVE